MLILPKLVVSLLDCGLCTCFLIEAINVNKKREGTQDGAKKCNEKGTDDIRLQIDYREMPVD